MGRARNTQNPGLLKDNDRLYRAKALRVAFRKLGHNLSLADVLTMMENILCPYCRKAIDPLDYSIDHKTPKNRGGSNDLDNLHLVCIKCNRVKGDLEDSEFRELMKFLRNRPAIYNNLYVRLRMANMIYWRSRGRVK